MTSTLGYLAVGGALLLSLAGAAAAFMAVRTESAGLRTFGRRAAYGVFGLATLAIGLMIHALVVHDFSVSYVAQVGSRSTPTFYTVISLWSSLDGSILFWGWIIAGYTAAVAYVYRNRFKELMPATTGTLLSINVFFWLLLAWPANPFTPVWPVPADGPGPNPLLQNHPFMGLHPPLLYLGYVGMGVPFAFGIAALITGKVGGEWIRAVRRWLMAPWIFLTAGIVAGAWWSYEVLGWGGYWAWDPVENASFLPWLTATAFLHSIMVQERRQTLKTWNILLVITTFVLTLFGTFLTRSGILESVHAFSEGLIGPFFLGFIALVMIVSLGLVVWRSEELRSEPALDSLASRETAFLLNNLLFVAFTFTVLLGTMYPILAEAARGVKVSVGAPYFNEMSVPIALALIFLTGVGPALPWRRGSPELLRKKFRWPTITALVAGALFFLVGVRQLMTLAALVFAVFAIGLIAGEFWRPVKARRHSQGESFSAALSAVLSRSRRRYGGYIVHVGVIVLAVGVALSATYRAETEATMQPGQTIEFKGYRLRLDSLYAGREPNRDFVEAAFSVGKGQRLSTVMTPRLNYYPMSTSPIGSPAVRTRPDADFYLSLAAYSQNGASATVNIIVNPMIVWIWIGGGICVIGALFAISSLAFGAERSERKRAAADSRAKPVGAAVGGSD